MEKANKQKNFIKIILPIIIVAVVAGIWIVKNSQKQMVETPAGTDNADFLLTTTELDLEQLKSHGIPIMIDFGADSCIPCKEMAPVLKELNEAYQGKIIVKFVDVWKDGSLAEDFPLEVIPTQFFFDKDGKPFVPSDPEGMQMMMYSMKDTNEHVFTAHQGGMTKEQILAVFKELGVEPND